MGVDGLEADVEGPAGGLDHAGEEEGGGVVGDDEAGTARQGLEQPPSGTDHGLDVGKVGEAPRESGSVVGHSVEQEAVEAGARPGVIDPERLEDQDRLAQVRGPLDGALQGEVPGGAPGGDHPVEDPVAVALG